VGDRIARAAELDVDLGELLPRLVGMRRGRVLLEKDEVMVARAIVLLEVVMIGAGEHEARLLGLGLARVVGEVALVAGGGLFVIAVEPRLSREIALRHGMGSARGGQEGGEKRGDERVTYPFGARGARPSFLIRHPYPLLCSISICRRLVFVWGHGSFRGEFTGMNRIQTSGSSGSSL
jgi:hypothetical protein